MFYLRLELRSDGAGYGLCWIEIDRRMRVRRARRPPDQRALHAAHTFGIVLSMIVSRAVIET